jgi:cbb3-type cytochrome oxidase maturation protein
MTILYLILPLAILLAIAALAGFIWAVRQGQFDDLDTPALRVMTDDDE